MQQPTISPAEAEQLVDELADALVAMIDASCVEMGPLWLADTHALRAELTGQVLTTLGFEPSPRFLALSKGARSKYRGLAAWRHAVLWMDILPAVDRDYARALEAVYFTAYPANSPPYAWSRSAKACPRVSEFASPSTLKTWAAEGAWLAVDRLIEVQATLMTGSRLQELTGQFIHRATRRSLRDVLKLDLHRPHIPAKRRLAIPR